MDKRMKQCSCCGQLFPVEDFGMNRLTVDGRAYYTKAHAAAKQRQFRQDRPDSVAASKKKYLDKLRQQNAERYSGKHEPNDR